MLHTTLIASLLLSLMAQGGAKADDLDTGAESPVAQAATQGTGADDRLLIVNGNSGHVIYDDGRNDLFCVTRRVVVGYDLDGNPIRHRTMRCR